MRRRVVVRGRVQGVFFRDTVRRQAAAARASRAGCETARRGRRGGLRGRRGRRRAAGRVLPPRAAAGARCVERRVLRRGAGGTQRLRACGDARRIGLSAPAWSAIVSRAVQRDAPLAAPPRPCKRPCAACRPRPAQAARTGSSWSSSPPSARAATSSTSPSTRRSCTLLDVHYILAAVLAFCVAVTNNFLWNRHWTFEATDGHMGFQARALPDRQRGRARLQPGRARAARERRRTSRRCSAQAIAILAATPLNFIGNKLWSFGDLAGPAPPARPLAARRARCGDLTAAVALCAPPPAQAAARGPPVQPGGANRPRRSRGRRRRRQPPRDHFLNAVQAARIAARASEAAGRAAQARRRHAPRRSPRARAAGR